MSAGWYEPVEIPSAPVYVVGCDLAQTHDYTGISVLERLGTPATTAVRHLDRFRDRPYTDIARHVRGLVTALRSPRPRPDVSVVVDGTGIGAAVVDVMREAEIDATIVSVIIHGGDRTSSEHGTLRVPKRDLVSSVAVALQAGTLKIAPDLTLAPVLTEELSRFRMKFTRTGHDSYEAWRESDHDDLVLSVSLGLWYAETYGSGQFQALPAATLAVLSSWVDDP